MDITNLKRRLLNSKLFKDSTWALLGSVLGKGLSLVAGIAVARFLGKEIYGEYGMIKNTLFQIAVFSTLGLGYTGTRFISKYLNDEKEYVRSYIRIIYNITLIISGLLALFTFIFSQQIANYLDVPDTSLAFKFTAFIIVANAMVTAQIGILSGFKDFKVVAKNNTWAGLATFATSVLFTCFWGLYGALVALLVSMVLNAIMNSISIRKKTRELPLLKNIDPQKYGEIVKFSIPIALQESLYSIVAWALSVMIIKFSDYGELGLYQAAAQWSSIVLFIPGVLKNVILSYFSSTADTKKMRKIMLIINFCATFFPFLFISVLSSYISGFYGSTFVNLPPVIIISCLVSVFVSIAGVLLYELISAGNTWASFLFRLFRDSMILGLCYISLSNKAFNLQASVSVVIIQCVVSLLFAALIYMYVIINDKRLNLI